MTKEPWVSDLAGVHARTLRSTKGQTMPALTVVNHITGRDTYNHAAKALIPPLKQLDGYFGTAGNPFAHYSVDPWGRIGCHASELQTPWAQGWAAYAGMLGMRQKIATGTLTVPKWWLAFWLGYKKPWMDPADPKAAIKSPVDLLPPGTQTPNERSIAIEFIQWGNQLKLTVAQYKAGAALLLDICTRHSIPMCPPYVRGHESCDPWSRGTATGGWDPGELRPNPTFSFALLVSPPSEEDASADGAVCIATPEMPDWAK